VIGQDVIFNEHIATTASGQTQLLFLDESSMSVGPNSDLTIDQFVYDPKSGTGKLAMSATRGLLRYVGGKLSKQDDAVTLRTATATLAVRGGAFIMAIGPGGKMDVTFLYGKGLTVTGLAGGTVTITRPGFAVTVVPGAAPSQPGPAPTGQLAQFTQQLDGRSGNSGGAAVIPSDTDVANSGVSQTISGNLTQSVQQADQNQGAAQATAQTATNTSPVLTSVNTVQSTTNQNTLQSTTNQDVSARQPPPPHLNNFIAQPPTPTPTPTQPGITTQPVTTTPTPVTTTPTPVITPQPVIISVAGLVKGSSGFVAGLGFVNQTATDRVPFTGGTITYPPGSVLQNGTLTFFLNDNNPGQVTLSPLNAGSTPTAVTGQKTTGSGTGATGTAFTNADSSFVYTNLTSNDGSGPIFGFAGVPVSQSFYAGNLPGQITAFKVNPDGALANGSQAQTIPFLPPADGGTMANATVSPLYLITGANSPFGAANSTNGLIAPKFLQASLAVNGQGTNQTSALVVAAGSFFTSADTGQVVGSVPMRGTVMTSATSPAMRIASGVSTVPDGNGNNLFGGNTLEGFVLDQNQYNFNGNFVPALATAAQFGATTVNYAFNQPVTATTLPANVGAIREALNESGYFGGLMTQTTNPTTGSPYVLSGVVSPLQSALSNNRIAATFTGTDPFTAKQSGIFSVVLNFGGLDITTPVRAVYIDNNIFAAADSALTQSSINGNLLPLPQNNTSTAPSPSLAMVTSGTVPNTSWMPAGVTPCTCQFLQWGYWTGQVASTTTSGLGVAREDRAYINTWVAGTPTVTMPTTGIGTYNGAAIGTVFNAGATYLAAGGFSGIYNFGTQSGTMAVSNFDNKSFSASGSAPLSGANYTFNISPTTAAPIAGTIKGSFFGPNAKETGGNFSVHTTLGPTYLASGIFAGKQ